MDYDYYAVIIIGPYDHESETPQEHYDRVKHAAKVLESLRNNECCANHSGMCPMCDLPHEC